MPVETSNNALVASFFERSGSALTRELLLGSDSYRSEVEVGDPSDDALGDWWLAYLRGRRPAAEARGTVRAIDLFCGAGGLTLGLSQACAELGLGVAISAAVDHDPGAVRVYDSNHHPHLAASLSVSELVDPSIPRGRGADARFRYPPEVIHPGWEELVGKVDVILAGPPCQGHSSLNNYSRRDDLRNELYLAVPAIALALRAPVVIIENVPGVVHDRLGVVATTAALLKGAGYFIEQGVLHAEKLGWPQRRARFFMVARRDTPPLALGHVATALADAARSAMWAIADLADVPPDERMHRHPELSEENARRIEWLFDNDEYDLALSERPECHREGTTYKSVYGRMRPDEPAQTITTGFMTAGRGRFIHPTRRRVLRPAEAARLQGFPDTYVFDANGKEPPASLKLAKWIGDAVPMPLGHAATIAALAGGVPPREG